jgi:hypothetical protein
MGILINHFGYTAKGLKNALLQWESDAEPSGFDVLDERGRPVFGGEALRRGQVEGWNTGWYWALDFSALQTPGQYRIRLKMGDHAVCSPVFEISERLYTLRLMGAAAAYFKAQRVTGEWREADRSLPYEGGRPGRTDLHGGWHDASGDYGVHLSHLSFTSVFNPQQACLCGYTLLKAAEHLVKRQTPDTAILVRKLRDEGTYGADFLMRARIPGGSFLRSIDSGPSWEAPPGNRFIDYETFHSSGRGAAGRLPPAEPIREANYEVGFRSGGGLAIATLAAAARQNYGGTAFSPAEYAHQAAAAFAALWRHNENHVNDGSWNLLDEYCALTAATELYQTTGEEIYLQNARELCGRVTARLAPTRAENAAWFEARPGELFFHPSDEGLPLLALAEYARVEPDASKRGRALTKARQAMRHCLAVTGDTVNPFGYPRFLPSPKGPARFFFPHNTAAAPWWQGENARIACLAAAARALAGCVEEKPFRRELLAFAQNQENWIMGLNPFDSCMMEGYGRRNIQYFCRSRYDFLNSPGGICNGITAGPPNGEGICFITAPTADVDDNWRWAEQWLPHASWFLYLLALK